MKKFFVLLFVLNAQTLIAEEKNLYKENKYFACVGVGFETFHSKRNLEIHWPGGGVDSFSGSSKTNGGSVFVSGGHQINLPRTFLSLEAYVSFSNSQKKFTPDPDFRSSLSKKFSTGFLVRVGRPFSYFSPYVITGFEFARFAATFENLNLDGSAAYRKSRVCWKPAAILGFGIEKPVLTKTSIRFEYTVRIFEKFRKNCPAPESTLVLQEASSMRSHSLILGLLYNF